MPCTAPRSLPVINNAPDILRTRSAKEATLAAAAGARPADTAAALGGRLRRGGDVADRPGNAAGVPGGQHARDRTAAVPLRAGRRAARRRRARQFAWAMPARRSAAPVWVLYLHGNATSVASQVNIAHYRVLRNAGLNVLAPEYRGFGGLPGSPTEAALQADARAAYDYLRHTRRVPPHTIVLYGWSLGAAVAVDLASRLPPAAIILEGAPASLIDLTGRRYPFFPAAPVHAQLRSTRSARSARFPRPCCSSTRRPTRSSRSSEGRRLYQAAQGREDVRRGAGRSLERHRTIRPRARAGDPLVPHAPMAPGLATAAGAGRM